MKSWQPVSLPAWQTHFNVMEQVLSLVEKARSFHSRKTLATDVAKTDTRKHRTAKLWTLCAEVVEKRDTLRKSVESIFVSVINIALLLHL